MNDEEKLIELVKAEKRTYFKKWRDTNKDKVKEHNARYWKKYAEKKLREREEKEDVIRKTN